MLFIIIIVDEICINLSILYIEETGQEKNNIMLYKSTLISIIAALIANICIALMGETQPILKVKLIVIAAFYLIVTLPIIVKKIKRISK